MCLAVPVKIVSVEGNRATVEFAGNRRMASLMLVPQAKVGDWVLLHAGFAITVLEEEDARESLRLLGIESEETVERQGA
jgi:hydrogenase expression/formation protein HypC